MGSKRAGNGVDRVYDAAQKWVDCALRVNGSLFTPGNAIWTRESLALLHDKFLNSPDETDDMDGKFLDKLEKQLEGSPADVYQLMGEALYFYFLIVHTKSGAGEKNVIDAVLRWSESPVEIPPELVAALTPGIANPGTAFHRLRPFQVGLLIELAERLKQEESSKRAHLLDDPWAFKRYVMDFRPRSRLVSKYQNASRIQRQALLHLVHPDTFEGIVSEDHKSAVADAFSTLVTQPTDDVDFQLQQIRTGLERKLGRDFHFYEADIRRKWGNTYEVSSRHWDEYVARAKVYVNTGALEAEEIKYKVDIGEMLAFVRKEVLENSKNWAALLKNALTDRSVNFVRWSLTDDFTKWCLESPDEAVLALERLWADDDTSVTDRIKAFSRIFPKGVISGRGTRLTMEAALLMGVDVYKYPPYMETLFSTAYELTEYGQPDKDVDEATLYEYALGFLDRFMDEGKKRGLKLRHRLDAQSVAWALWKDRDGPIECCKDSPPWSPENIGKLAGELMWETKEMQSIIDGLEDKGQVIFQGPPGTGKTFVAKRIGEFAKEHGGDYKIVQFHPSYSYEDFVEGYRPTLVNGNQAGFELRDGPLKEIAKKAEQNDKAKFILVIDEINRTNVSKVLGELYFLLEYRGEGVPLLYSKEEFKLPNNLWFIGTMNTTDRSIALVDAALRRRFYFYNFFPDQPPIEGLLRRWLEKNDPDMIKVADLVDHVNKALEDRHLSIGPSHFMKKEKLNKDKVRFIWERAVFPYIEEQLFGGRGDIEKYKFEKLESILDGNDNVPSEGSTT